MLQWGENSRRQFPWRQTSDPYCVFVAECLVQRTKAEQAQPAYLRFLERFPDIESLSRATEGQIRPVVRSLGLTYRVRRIHTLAREVLRVFGGRFPDNLGDLRRLYGKGFGDYMAHAILCFAFANDVPVVDKNVERILKRVFSIQTRKDGHRDRRLWLFAERLVPRGRAKEYNWSLIDFGALVCTPKNPRCPTCPVLDICDYGKVRIGRLA
jgi:A/G-specific adenine glycosylase